MISNINDKNKKELLHEFVQKRDHNTLEGEQYSTAIFVKIAEDVEGSINNLKEEIHSSTNELVKTSKQASKDSNKHSRQMGFYTFGLVIIAFVQVLVTVIVPLWQEKNKQKNNVVALYSSIIANQDIFIDNTNSLRNFKASTSIAYLPRSYVNSDIDNSIHELLQQRLGTINYEFLLYYLDQTKLLNSARDDILSSTLTHNTEDDNYFYKKTKDRYLEIMDHLDSDNLETKFNYIYDTACLAFMLQQSFSFIEILERQSTLNCSDESLERKRQHFGNIPIDTPEWEKML